MKGAAIKHYENKQMAVSQQVNLQHQQKLHRGMKQKSDSNMIQALIQGLGNIIMHNVISSFRCSDFFCLLCCHHGVHYYSLYYYFKHKNNLA